MKEKNQYMKAVLSILPFTHHRRVIKELYKDLQEIENLSEVGTPEEYVSKIEPKKVVINQYYYYRYSAILQIVLATIIGTLFIGYLFQFILFPSLNLSEMILFLVPRSINALAQGFLWVTISFIIFQYLELPFHASVDQQSRSTSLRHDWTIFKIVFFTFMITLVSFIPDVFIWKVQGSSPIFNLKTLEHFQYYLVLIFVLILFKSIIRIYQSRLDYRSAMLYSICNLLSLLFIVGVMNYPNVFSQDFILYIERDLPMVFQLGNYLSSFSSLIGWAIILIYLVDTAIVLYRGLKNDREDV